ncbi:MAG: esterase-like activity of phytase family protein [Elainella sp.]
MLHPLTHALRQRWLRFSSRPFWILTLLLAGSLAGLLSGCSLPQVKPEDRLFLPLSLEFVGSYTLPKQSFQDTRVGGLSGLTYDRQRNQFYAVSDDRSDFAPARFYTLKMTLSPNSPEAIKSIELAGVTTLKSETGAAYAKGTVDLEGIALSPRQTLFISSEGNTDQGIPPFVDEFDLTTGNWRSRLPIATRYLPNAETQTGVQNNQGFESLALSAISPDPREPFRLFTATESALQQDLPEAPADPAAPTPLRFLHYLIGEDQTLLISEHLYPLDPLPPGDQNLGLTDLLVLDQGGHFLGLERGFGPGGFTIKMFQLATGGATDISPLPRLSAGVEGIVPIQKRLLLDLSDLNIPLDNFEGLTFGPQFPDGSPSIIAVSDDNFNELQVTEFLLFRLKSGGAG